MRIFIPTSRAAEDNRSMNKERDLLPWIFGGLSAAAIAVAFAAVSTHRAEATLAPPASIEVGPGINLAKREVNAKFRQANRSGRVGSVPVPRLLTRLAPERTE